MRRPFWIPLAGSRCFASVLTWMVAHAACTGGSPDSPSDAVSTGVRPGGRRWAVRATLERARAIRVTLERARAVRATLERARAIRVTLDRGGRCGQRREHRSKRWGRWRGRDDGRGADGTGGTNAMHLDDAGSYRAGLPRFILGADVSSLLERERAGAQFYDKGTRGDLLSIMKSRGFNYIRIRTWVDPTAAGGYASRQSRCVVRSRPHDYARATRETGGHGVLVEPALQRYLGRSWAPGQAGCLGHVALRSITYRPGELHDPDRQPIEGCGCHAANGSDR